MPDSSKQPFLCRGCGRPIDKLDVSIGHSDNCPFWGQLSYARIDRNSLHELLRGPNLNHPVRAAAYDLANVILGTTPVGIPQQAALRHVHAALMAASSAIAAPNDIPPPAVKKEIAVARANKDGGRRRKTPTKKRTK